MGSKNWKATFSSLKTNTQFKCSSVNNLAAYQNSLL